MFQSDIYSYASYLSRSHMIGMSVHVIQYIILLRGDAVVDILDTLKVIH
jgi:hypothetical protein